MLNIQGPYRSAIHLSSVSKSHYLFLQVTREVRRFLLDLDYYIYIYSDTDPLGVFHLFLKRTADVLAPRLAVVFWGLIE